MSSHLHTTAAEPPRFSEDIDNTCSTPFAHGPSGVLRVLFSLMTTPKRCPLLIMGRFFLSSNSGSFEFEFSSRFSLTGSMTSADELFFNGQIRPMRLSSHLHKPQDQFVGPILDLDFGESSNVRGQDLRLRGTAQHRKAKSMSPFRATDHYEWNGLGTMATTEEIEAKESESSETTPSCSASSSRSSSSGRNSKKWIFLKDLLHRSKSEGRANDKERFWSTISFNPAKEKVSSSSSPSPAMSPSSSRGEKKGKNDTKKGRKVQAAGKPANFVGKRRVPPSAHELHYTANRAQTEEMKKKTFLPYRQGLFGCLGFSSTSYGAFTGFTRNLNPISSW